jgi:hypothetical protein
MASKSLDSHVINRFDGPLSICGKRTKDANVYAWQKFVEDRQCSETKLMMAKNQIDYDKRDSKTRVNIFPHSKIFTSVFNEWFEITQLDMGWSS